jgi:hypothetical protein
MQLYAPQTKIEGRWRDGVVISIGIWLSMLGGFAWWADYLLYSIPERTLEWTADQKEKKLVELIEKAKSQGVVEPSLDEKMRALELFQPTSARAEAR